MAEKEASKIGSFNKTVTLVLSETLECSKTLAASSGVLNEERSWKVFKNFGVLHSGYDISFASPAAGSCELDGTWFLV